MSGTPLDDLVHRVNNLLGTIEVQLEVAKLDGSLDAHREALRHIAESARRTREHVQQLRAGGDARGARAD